jgi:transcriptional regulator with XRE-family HTH domain
MVGVPDLLNTTGKRIKLLRHDLDLTQEEIRRRLHLNGVDIHQSYISSLERSNSLPSGEVLAGLARVLHTTTDYLLLLTDDPLIPGEPDEDVREVGDEEWALLLELRRLPEVDRRSLVKVFYELIGLGRQQAERTGRPFGESPLRGLPRPPQSREDMAVLLMSLPDAALDELVGRAAEILRKNERTA